MTYPVPIAVDATAVVIEIVDAATTAAVHQRVPDPRPAEFVLVRRVGGIRQNRVSDEATILIEAYSASEEEAHDLAQVARQAIHEARGQVVSGATIGRTAELSGPGNLPDPLSDQPRYVQTITVALRGS